MTTLATLKNGLRVILVPCEAQSVAFGLFVASGSRHESDKTSGISHFIEHMLFKGTSSRSALAISQAIEGRGGHFNACTSEEVTTYFAHMPFEYLDEAVDIISDMYLHSTFPAAEFDREKQVVLEEIKMYGDLPDCVAAENLQRSLFPKSRLGVPVAGSADSLQPLRSADLISYMKRHYLPTNTIAVVAGRFDPDVALKAITRQLGSLRRSSKAFASADSEPLQDAPVHEISVSKDVKQAQLALGYRTFGVTDPRKYAAVVFDALMGRGTSSRLYQQVREKRGLSYDIMSRLQFFTDAGMWTVFAGLDAKKAKLALATIDRELKRIVEKPVSPSELRRVKEFLVGNFRISNESVTSRMFFHGSTTLAFGRLVDPEEQIAGIRAVTARDVQDVARFILDPNNRSVSWVTPR